MKRKKGQVRKIFWDIINIIVPIIGIGIYTWIITGIRVDRIIHYSIPKTDYMVEDNFGKFTRIAEITFKSTGQIEMILADGTISIYEANWKHIGYKKTKDGILFKKDFNDLGEIIDKKLENRN